MTHQLEIGFHAGQKKKQKNAELRDGVDHRLLFGIVRKQHLLKIGQYEPKQRRAEQQPGDQLPHDGRLAHAQHGFAEQPADDHQRQNLRDENDLRGAFMGLLGSEGGPCRQRKQRERQAEPAVADLGHRWRRPSFRSQV